MTFVRGMSQLNVAVRVRAFEQNECSAFTKGDPLESFEGIDAEVRNGPITHRSRARVGRKGLRLGMGFEMFLDRRGGRDAGTAGYYSQDKLPHVLRALCRESV
jgi:hypothetical protein